MEEISKLIREARPLYFARKRRRKVMKAVAGGAAGLTLLFAVFVRQTPQPLLFDAWTEELYMTENGSVIEDMGLPVDEYGLLMVS
jgi:hypothetical protein